MNKNFTIQLTINDLASKVNSQFKEKKEIFDFENEFEDVFEKLDELNCDVRQEVVDTILEKAKKSL